MPMKSALLVLVVLTGCADDEPTCADAMANYYTTSCVVYDKDTGSALDQESAEAACNWTTVSDPCMGLWNEYIDCLSTATSDDCDYCTLSRMTWESCEHGP